MRRSSSVGGAERRRSLPRSTPRRTAGRALDRAAPARDVGKRVERLAERLGDQHPRPRGHVGDRIVVAKEEGAPLEPALEHAEAARVFVGVALPRIGVLALRIIDEMAELPGHRPEAADLPEQPFQHLLPPARLDRREAPRFLGQMQQDRARLEDRQRAARHVVIDDRRHVAVGADREEGGFVLRAGLDVDRDHAGTAGRTPPA